MGLDGKAKSGPWILTGPPPVTLCGRQGVRGQHSAVLRVQVAGPAATPDTPQTQQQQQQLCSPQDEQCARQDEEDTRQDVPAGQKYGLRGVGGCGCMWQQDTLSQWDAVLLPVGVAVLCRAVLLQLQCLGSRAAAHIGPTIIIVGSDSRPMCCWVPGWTHASCRLDAC